MIRYRLDDLGWYQFEWLVQSLLKAELGLGVESWGGRSDYGRDAYFAGSLNFPAKHLTSEGPFLFQVKFVENANAAGAEPDETLLDAVRKEVARVKARSQQPAWRGLQHYALLTNAPMSGVLRDRIKDLLHQAIPDAQIHCLGGNDICDLLDKHVSLRRSFPQLLSLRDLDDLLQDAVGKEILERSRRATECGRDIMPVFVPTSPYDRAWTVLRKHHFAVLEGPPEMGKTAIAWMIALAQLSQGWQAIVCDGPEDVFQCYKPGSYQVFVADDAFGRTEYDPSRGSKWEGQLDHVHRLLDSKHWLLWTSRKHILERALKVMDLQGEASDFPNPAAILVDASQLSMRERALILYRHARAAGLEKEAKDLVRGHARLIANDPNFTPERIRRFVRERLPELALEMARGHLDAGKVSIEIREAIRNPTDRMRKSFRALPATHKWVLISLLEAGDFYGPSPEKLSELYEAHCPAEARRPFTEVFEELSESFIKSRQWTSVGLRWIDWTHPSYRDLVIEELVGDSGLHLKFLQSMSLQGIKLAISDSGGAAGDRRLPLMTSARSWDLLHERCVGLIREGLMEEIADLLKVLHSAALQTSEIATRDRFVRIIASVCEEARNKWDKSGTVLKADQLSAYCEASLLVSPLPILPKLEASWEPVERALREELEETGSGMVLEPHLLKNWVELVVTIRENEPRFLRRIEFPEKYTVAITRLLDLIEDELQWHAILDSAEDLRAEAERFASITDILKTLSSVTPAHGKRSKKLAAKLKSRSSSLQEEASELEPPEPDYGDDSSRDLHDTFDIEGLFSDL